MVWRLAGVYRKNLQIIGYDVVSESGQHKKAKEEALKQLAEKGMAEGFWVDRETGDLMIDSRVYQSLEDKDTKFKIVDRIKDEDKTIGYVLESEEGQKRLPIDQVWQLALDGCVLGAEAKVLDSYKGNQKIVIVDRHLV